MRRNMGHYKVEPFDKYMKYLEITNDYHIRANIEFLSPLNTNVLKGAIKRSFSTIPILGSKLIQTNKKMFWDSSISYQETDYFKIIEGTLSDTLFNEVLCKIPNKSTGPQILFTVVKQNQKDTLIIVVNHMVLDGSGLKEYIYLLSSLYNDETKDGKSDLKSRDISNIIKKINLFKRFGILFSKSANEI